MRRLVLSASLIGLTFAATACQNGGEMPMKHLTVQPADMKWEEPKSVPPGAKIAVLEGDMSKPGIFTARVWAPDGYRVPPHWHPNVERVTVLSGTLYLGEGDTFDQAKAQTFPAGAYTSMPAGMHHFAWTKGETVFQITTMGPWGITYVNAADDPRNKGASMK